MDAEAEEWISHSLMEAERRRSIAKVISYSSEDAVPKGNNYTSQMYRLKVKVVNGRGELEERSVIYKMLPTNQHRQASMKQTGFYLREAKMYTEVLPELEKILRNSEPGAEILWPHCYGVKGRCKAYLLEDLKASGYRMADRMQGLDYAHASLVIDSLAKFHALTAVLMEAGELNTADFTGYWMAKSPQIAGLVFMRNLLGLAESLKKWPGEWSSYSSRLEKFGETFIPKYLATVAEDRGQFKVLCHADAWVNNFMFKYRKGNQPIAIKFLDFQLSCISGPGLDLQYFFYLSLHPTDLEEDKRPELIQAYHSALTDYLTQFGYRAQAPSFQDILDSYEGLAFHGTVAALGLRPLLMAPEGETPDMDKFHDELAKGVKLPFLNFSFTSDSYIRAIKCALKDAEKHGFL